MILLNLLGLFKKMDLLNFFKNMNKSKKRLAFTLAEVLIVMSIIGIIAEMTIPSLMSNIKKNQFQTQLKKEYAAFNQALLMLGTDSGGDFTSALTSAGISATNGQASDSQAWLNLLATKMNVVKTCPPGNTSTTAYGGCYASLYNYYIPGGTTAMTAWIDTTIRYAGVLSDGAVFSVWSLANGNTCTNTSYPSSIYNGNICASITVDVNGPGAPNKFGADMFCLFITAKGVYPVDIGIVGDDCGGGAGTGIGMYCAYKALNGISYPAP